MLLDLLRLRLRILTEVWRSRWNGDTELLTIQKKKKRDNNFLVGPIRQNRDIPIQTFRRRIQWRRVGQIFAGARGNNEFESQARSAVIEGAKRRSTQGGSGMPPGNFFFK